MADLIAHMTYPEIVALPMETLRDKRRQIDELLEIETDRKVIRALNQAWLVLDFAIRENRDGIRKDGR